MSRILVVDDSATVRRVVERTLERAGYDVTTAADGREALEHAQRSAPDLVLLDFAMPHMNGWQVCEALRAIANLREVPVVLMSAKADRIAEEFVKRTGAVDAISKPFGPEALLAVTTNALSRKRAEPEPTVAPSEPVRETPSEPPPDVTSQADRVARVVGPIVRKLGPSPTDEALAAALADALDAGMLAKLATDLAGTDGRGEVSFRGRIEHVPLGEILQLLQHQRQTGTLEVRRADQDEQVVFVCMREGLVDIALGRGGEHDLRLGRFLREEDLVDGDDLEILLQKRSSTMRLLGAQLVKLGYISQDDLHRALVRQTSELVYEALRWHVGTYVFERYATRPEATDARLGLPVASILMEGLRRIDEWRLIEEQIRSFDMVLAVRQDAVAALDPDALSREERQVLGAIDGERSVRGIVAESRMGSFDACKILFQLMTSGLVRAAA